MTRSAYLIFNPVSGQGDADEDLAKIKSILTPEFDLDIHETTKEVGADELARQALEQNAEIVIASGGDGTVSSVAGVLTNTGVSLGIVARGTANAFASALELPNSLEEQCKTIVGGKTRVIDTAKCDDRAMILITAIGFEADTVEEADREMKDNLGVLAYIYSGIKQLRKFKKFNVVIETPEETTQVNAVAVTVANIAPPSSLLAQGAERLIADDGFLDVTVVAPETRVNAIGASYHLLKKALQKEAVKHQDISHIRTKKVTILANPTQKVAIDGEVDFETPITIECVPQSLKVFVPTEEQIEDIKGLPSLSFQSADDDLASSADNTVNKTLIASLISGAGIIITILILL